MTVKRRKAVRKVRKAVKRKAVKKTVKRRKRK
jgi:hypothetical protein